jgi:hypothetical protein
MLFKSNKKQPIRTLYIGIIYIVFTLLLLTIFREIVRLASGKSVVSRKVSMYSLKERSQSDVNGDLTNLLRRHVKSVNDDQLVRLL